MGGMQKLGFFAYPDGYPIIGEAIEGAVQLAREAPMVLKPWQAMQIVGFKLDDQVRANVAAAAVLIGDITYPNMNVFYEMGYAIAIGKPVVPTVNVALDKAVQPVNNSVYSIPLVGPATPTPTSYSDSCRSCRNRRGPTLIPAGRTTASRSSYSIRR
jgi:hypothetical protein